MSPEIGQNGRTRENALTFRSAAGIATLTTSVPCGILRRQRDVAPILLPDRVAPAFHLERPLLNRPFHAGGSFDPAPPPSRWIELGMPGFLSLLGQPLTTFSDFGLSPLILKALASEGYTDPTPIQAQAIPTAMEGRDILGIAQTGTGKTAAFALPIIHRLLDKPRVPTPKGCRALILAPTRELAGQIADSFKAYGRHCRLSITTVFGGVSIGKQERQVAGGVDILVATPGRLLDLIDRRTLSIRDLDILVLDEADQMLDLGFIHALKRIVTLIPAQRQSLFFSATMPKTISGLADSFLSNPAKVAVAPVATTAERVEQYVMHVPVQKKQAVLNKVLEDKAMERVLVFTRTKHGADRVVRYLHAAKIEAAAIHGNKSQAQRERALKAFKDGECPILVATDIAARGIDVDGVSHVVNFDLPNVPESYVHRIGRTARAGRDGIALSLCADDEKAFLRDIERLTRQRVFVVPIPDGCDFTVKGGKLPESELVEDERRDGRRSGGQRSGGYRNDRRPEGRPENRGEQRPDARRDAPRDAHRDDRRAAPAGGQRGPVRYEGNEDRSARPARAPAPHSHGASRDGGHREHAQRDNAHRDAGHRDAARGGRGGPAGQRQERPQGVRADRPAGAGARHRERD
jgi:ATP-dependent RNA helicase RhlE